METSPHKFRKAAFGGFNKEDVVAYIEQLKRDFADYKQQVEETVEALQEKVAALEGNAPDEKLVASSAEGDITAATERLKAVTEALCENFGRLFSQLPPEDSVAVPAAQDDDPVAKIMQGLFSTPDETAPKAAAPADTAARLAACLPQYLAN